MEFPATVVTVFGHSIACAKEWVERNMIIPDKVRVLLVENLTYPCPEILAWLLYAVHQKPNWRIVTTARMNFPVRGCGVSHGEALDFALNYVHTKYVITMDSDTFIKDTTVFDAIVDMAEKEKAYIVGTVIHPCALPYISPIFALYRTDAAQKWKFKQRFYSPQIPKEFLTFWQHDEEKEDVWAEVRKTYLDVGQEIYLRAKTLGLKVIENFPVYRYVEHTWHGTPSVHWEQPYLKEGLETWKERILWR